MDHKDFKIYLPVIVCASLAAAFLLTAVVVRSQSTVSLSSVTPTSGYEGVEVIITGSNLFQCSPTGSPACNVQFFDGDLRRSTVSGTEESDTRVRAVVAPGLCPGRSTIRVGEVLDVSNAITFTVLDPLVAAGPPDPTSVFCRFIYSVNPTSSTPGTIITLDGRNLHTTVRFYNSSGTQVATATGTSLATYQVTTDDGPLTFISRMSVTVPANLPAAVYTIRVGTNQMVNYNSGAPIQLPDISNAIDFRVLSGDTSPPTISNVRATNITSTSATILWDTNEPADSQVEYCLDQNRCGVNTALDTNRTLSHSVNLTGLTPATYYNYWVKSRDAAGNLRTRGYFLFTTLNTTTSTPTPTPAITRTPTPTVAPGDEISPVISNVQIINITRTSATVTWDTDEPADTRIGICLLGVICYSAITNPTMTTSHSADLVGLRAGTRYSFRARSSDPNGNQGVSELLSFETSPGLLITNIAVSGITQTSAIISWDTNYPANSSVNLCTFIFFCYSTSGAIIDPAFVLNHSMSVTNLQAGRRYYYRIISREDSGYTARARIASFTTTY